MIPLFKLQNHYSTMAVQLLVQVFHWVFHLHLWCSALHTTPSAASGRVAQLPRARTPPPRLPVSSFAMSCCLLLAVKVFFFFLFIVGVILANELTNDTLPEPRLGSAPHWSSDGQQALYSMYCYSIKPANSP
jgi:hypothetical protein